MSNLDVVIIIPARCGSKRVTLKNIRPICGKPLLLYSVEAAISSGIASQIIVSTDCEEISSIACKGGARVILRPPQLGSDNASTESVLLHCLEILEEEGSYPEWIMTLPPTSPFRGTDMIRKSCSIISSGEYDSLFTVHENRADFWQGEVGKGLTRLFPDAPRRQQDRMPLWEENSALYLTRSSVLREKEFILGNNSYGMPIDIIQGFDINTEFDFLIAETIMQKSLHEAVGC